MILCMLTFRFFKYKRFSYVMVSMVMLGSNVVDCGFDPRSGQTKERCEFEACSDEVYSIQHYVIKFVNDLRQVGDILWYPPPIKLTTTI
jgi:hypothetical protein